MTRLTTYTSDTTGDLLGVEYCEVPVHREISWAMYMSWASEAVSVEWQVNNIVSNLPFYEVDDLVTPTGANPFS